MKKIIFALTLAFSLSSFAVVREGPFNYRGNSYFSNGINAYCQKSFYDFRLPNLTGWEESDLQRMQFHGMCDDGYGQGPFNYRNRSYYSNKDGSYCQFSYYNQALQEFDQRQMQYATRGRYTGYCRN